VCQALPQRRAAGPAVTAGLARGDRIAIHCAAGLGRTGMLVAKLLVDLGMPAGTAIQTVREQRPGAIETAQQEAFVRHSPRLL
jgi:protein-tyrosine phosphatase